MIETTAAYFAGLWVALTKLILPLVPGAVGSALALKFLGEGLSFWQKVTSFSVGMACAMYIAPTLIEWLAIQGTRTQSGLEFLVGLFALAVCRELFKEINEADIIGTLKRRYLGPKP